MKRVNSIPFDMMVDVVKRVTQITVFEERKQIIEALTTIAHCPSRELGKKYGLSEQDMDTAILAVRTFVAQFIVMLSRKPLPDLSILAMDESGLDALLAEARLDKTTVN